MVEQIIRIQKINISFVAVTAVFFALCFFYLNQTAAYAGWIQKQKITSNPVGVGAQFGNAIAISGNRMVVGAPHHKTTTGVMTGAAFVYELINGTWTQKAQLFAAGGAAGDEFGYSVAISGNTIVVGAFYADSPLSNQGAAYVFDFNGTNWIDGPKLTASFGGTATPDMADDEFGRAVAIQGDTIVVGAHHADIPPDSWAGSAYIFTRSAGVWTKVQKLIPTGGGVANDLFGTSVAISLNKIVVGSPGADIPQGAAGSVYVFVFNGAGYILEDKISVPNTTGGDHFGYSVAIEGNILVGGAPDYTHYTPNGGTLAHFGAAYVYEFNGAGGPGWKSQAKLVASNGSLSDLFGWTVTVSTNTIAVGARGYDVPASPTSLIKPDAGLAYLFNRNGNTWSETKRFAPNDTTDSDRFGTSVALSSGGLVVGAAEKALNPGQGAAYYFIFPPKFDMDGDGKSDFAILRPLRELTGWLLEVFKRRRMSSPLGATSDKPVPADYDGDGKTDMAVFRSETGEWFILRSSDSSTYSVRLGNSEDKPVPDDYDGDGLADVAVFRPAEGNWYINQSTSGRTEVAEWGKEGDLPVTSDYDGDGRADLAVYRPSTGQWKLNRSMAGVMTMTFGIETDKPVPADYTGDGRADIAIWRAERGEWYVLRSEDSRYYVVPFGANGDIPVMGDYDGDRKADIGVFRPDGANWFIQRSTLGILELQFGSRGDIPVPSVFVP